MLNTEQLETAALALRTAEETREVIGPLTDTFEGIDVVDAYEIQLINIRRRIAAGAQIRGHKPINVASRVGGRLPAYCTGVGKALLAFNPEAALKVLAMPLTPRTPYTITSHQVLAEELARIRSTGLSYDREENSIGIVCVAAPIMLDDRAIGAISITCSPPKTDVQQYASAVKAAALGIRRSIARTPGLRPTDATRGTPT